MVRGLIPGRDKIFFLKHLDLRSGEPTFSFKGTGALSMGVKQLGHEVDRSALASAQFMNEWSYASCVPLWHAL